MTSPSLRVVTLNCLWQGTARARLRAIGRQLGPIGADLICLQEVVWVRRIGLLGWPHSIVRRTLGPGVVGGLVTLSTAPIEATSYEVYRQHGLWRTLGAADRLWRKGFLVSWLQHAGRPVVMINTHLLANYDEDWSPTNRFAIQQKSMLRQLASAVRALPNDRLLVVAGDFNVPTSHPIFVEFLADSGLRATHDWAAKPASRGYQGIDNVLYRPPLGAQVEARAEVRFEDPIQLAGGRMAFASDHVGVEAELSW